MQTYCLKIVSLFILISFPLTIAAQNTINENTSANTSVGNSNSTEINTPETDQKKSLNTEKTKLSDTLQFPLNNKSYLLKENYIRLNQLKQNLLNGINSISKLRLIFSHYEKDYLIFYDLNGHYAYFRYRLDRYDDKNTEKFSKLIKGFPYLIDVELKGIFLNEKKILKSDSEYFKSLENKSSILLLKIFNFKNLRLTNIRF